MYLNNINIPTWVTLLRVITIPFIVLFFYLPYSFCPLFSSVIFALASLTDWIDGFLARRWEQTTVFGAFLDPIIDKLLVVVALILIEEYYHVWWITLPIASIIIREILVLALREWVARMGYNVKIMVSQTSKMKTTMQMFSIILLLWHAYTFLVIIGIIVLYVACILTLWSILKYFRMVYKDGLFK